MARAAVSNGLCVLCITLLQLSLILGSEKFGFDGKFYLLDSVDEINPDIKWDDSGFLEDIADKHATCGSLQSKGMKNVEEQTPDGLPVVVIVDGGKGWMTDDLSISMYVRHVVHRWVNNPEYIKQFESCVGVACRTQPGCEGFTVVSCAFSYRISNSIAVGGTGRPRAFAPDQYELLEKLTGKIWDRSHFLENLASYDARCDLIQSKVSKLEETEKFVKEWNIQVKSEYGFVENKGSTDKAVVEIIREFRNGYAELTKIGCCLISDCKAPGKENPYVVVVCLYS